MAKVSVPVVLGLALVGAAGVAAVLTIPALREAVRPALKTGLKNVALASIALRREAAKLGEAWEDLIAEVAADMTTANAAGTSAAPASTADEPPAAKAPKGKRRTRKAA